MGLIHIELFATLDLVGQSPGGPDEDPVGFPFGGWQAPLLDEVAGAQAGAAYAGTDALLLGRRTYDIFAAYWPYQDGEDNEIATLFNSVPKYVASRGRPALSWAGSTQLGPDLAGAVREIRDRHEHVKVVGSLNLVQTGAGWFAPALVRRSWIRRGSWRSSPGGDPYRMSISLSAAAASRIARRSAASGVRYRFRRPAS